MRSPRIALFALVLPLVACGWSVRSLRWHTPDDVTLTYEFETEHRLSTTFERLPGSPGEDEVAAMEAQLDGIVFELRGTLEKFKAQYFVDRTAGIVVRLIAVEGSQRGPDGPTPFDTDGLHGKAVAMRTFESGEVFEAVGYEHFAGHGRYGELFAELFVQLMPRLPTEIPELDTPVKVRAGLPFRIDGFSESQQTWDLTYTRLTDPTPCLIGKACVELAYAGEVTEVALGRDPAHVTRVEGSGTVEGWLMFALDGRDFQEHRYSMDLERTILTYEGPFDPRKGEEGVVRAELRQRDQSETVMRRNP